MPRTRFTASLALVVAAACAPPAVPERGRTTVAVAPAGEREEPAFPRTKGRGPTRLPPDDAVAFDRKADHAPPADDTGVNTKSSGEDRLGNQGWANELVRTDLPNTDGIRGVSPETPIVQLVPAAPGPAEAEQDHRGPVSRITAHERDQTVDEEQQSGPIDLLPAPAVPQQDGAPTSLSAPPVFRTTSAAAEATRGIDDQSRDSDVPPEVADVLRRQGSGLQRCHDTLLLRNPEVAAGNVSVRLTISPAGTVAQADVVAGTIDDADFNRCILDRVLAWRFPRGDANTIVTRSFDFGGPVRTGFEP